MNTSGSEEQVELPRTWKIREARLPLVLIGVGLLVLIAYIFVTDVSRYAGNGSYSPLELRGFLAAKQGVILGIQLPLLFLGTLIITGLFRVSFGPRGIALLKLAALAIALLAVHRAVNSFFEAFFMGIGFVGSAVSKLITLGTFWILSVVLFKLDKVEIIILLAIATFLPMVAGIFLARLLFGVFS